MKTNSIILSFTSINFLNLFIKAEKITDTEIISVDHGARELVVPLYLKVNAVESDYVAKVEETHSEIKEIESEDDSEEEITWEKCPTDEELALEES